jgi:uncharacterized protein DUF929
VHRLSVGLVVAVALPGGVAHAAQRADGSIPAPAAISQLVTNVPASTLNKVGVGSIYRAPYFGPVKLGSQLTSAGKPEVLTVNLAWCPHCAANSWALAVALSRFGTLGGLGVINTGAHYCTLAASPCALGRIPCYPFTNGLSFFGASYRSRYLSLATVVLQDVNGHNLQRPTRRDLRAVNPFDPGAQQTPALDVGGAYGFLGPGFDPGSLLHKTWSQIAGSLADPQKPTARHIDGLANLFTAALCKVTKGRPGAVCTSKGTLAASSILKTAPSPSGPSGPSGPPPSGPPPSGPPPSGPPA